MDRSTRTRTNAWRLVGAAALVLGLVGSACAPTPGSPATPPAGFCELWDAVEATPGTLDEPVAVADDVVALADAAATNGGGCASPAAEVALDDALLADASPEGAAGAQLRTSGTTTEGDGDEPPATSVTGKRIAAQEPVLDNVSIDSLSAWIGWNGITIRGTASVQLSGATSVVGFTGTVRDLDNWSIQISSSAFNLPGITSTPATFSGRLEVRFGVPTLTLNAAVAVAEVGDLTVRNAAISLGASPSTGVAAAVSGAVEFGASTVEGSVEVRFDPVGTLVSVDADLQTRLQGFEAGGGPVRLDGQVSVEGTADETTVWFSGNGFIGDLQINDAHGSLRFVGDTTTFDGVIDARVDGVVVRYRGQIVFDGQTVTTPFLDLEAAGQISGVLPDGQLVKVDGQVELSSGPAGEIRTFVTGAFEVGSLHGSGTAEILVVGARTELDLEVELDGDGLDGALLTGQILLLDGDVEDLALDATVDQVQLASLTMSDMALSVRSGLGEPLEIRVAAGFQIDDLATGTLSGGTLRLGPDGDLLGISADVAARLSLDGTQIDVVARIDSTDESVTVDARGTVQGAVSVTVEGTLTVPVTGTADWSFRGNGSVSVGFLSLTNIGIAIEPGTFNTLVFGFNFFFLLADQFVVASLHFEPDGTVSYLDLRNSFGPFTGLISDALEDELGIPVQ